MRLPMEVVAGCIRDSSIITLSKHVSAGIHGLRCRRESLHAKKFGRTGLQLWWGNDTGAYGKIVAESLHADEIYYTLCSELSWSHISLIMRLDIEKIREYYLNESRVQEDTS